MRALNYYVFLKQLKNGLVFPGKFMDLSQERGGNETKIGRRGDTDIQELCKHMDKEFTGSDLMAKKQQFSFTDSNVVSLKG